MKHNKHRISKEEYNIIRRQRESVAFAEKHRNKSHENDGDVTTKQIECEANRFFTLWLENVDATGNFDLI